MRQAVSAGLVFALALFPSLASAADSESQMNQQGVEAVEAHWGRAFTGGDEAYLNQLLDEDYVSVSAKGVARTKADIVALADQIAAKNKAAPAPASPTTPTRKSVSKTTLHGATAVVTSTGFGQMSVDVFHYENGAWHAWYSQHTSIAPADVKS
jgi:hypothetical protein